MKQLALLLIRVYKFFSFFTVRKCRFYPTCSSYAYEAIDRFGFFKGSGKALSRIIRCHPWHPGGFDPVK